eukprot:scaffold5407_cov132-Cylindrotheca_fusiformis.AAC.7
MLSTIAKNLIKYDDPRFLSDPPHFSTSCLYNSADKRLETCETFGDRGRGMSLGYAPPNLECIRASLSGRMGPQEQTREKYPVASVVLLPFVKPFYDVSIY